MRDEFEYEMSAIIDAHTDIAQGDDETRFETRSRVSRSYRQGLFLDEESLFDDVDED